MSVVKGINSGSTLESPPSCLDIVSQGNSGGWVVNLPPRLQAYQAEIEGLLGRVFAGRPSSRENLELAQQMTINWCRSKCSKIGIKFEEILLA